MKDKATSLSSARYSLSLPPGGMLWLWVLLWLTGGSVIGGLTSKSIYESMTYGDYGGGAWIGGFAFLMLLCGGGGGMIEGMTATTHKDSALIVILRIIGGTFIGGIGSCLSFIIIIILMCALFGYADKYIAKASMPPLVIVSGLLIGGAAGVVLGILQVCLQAVLIGKREPRHQNLHTNNDAETEAMIMARDKSEESNTNILRSEDRKQHNIEKKGGNERK